MIFLKVFLLLILTVAFVIFAFSMRLKSFQKLGVIGGYFILFVFIANPEYADIVATWFSIKNGTDLVIYVVISITSLINIVLYVGQRNDNSMITTIIREGAKQNAKKCE
jgi:hypothetical protein